MSDTAEFKEGCLNCKFYLGGDGLCRRYPPVAIIQQTKKTGGDVNTQTWNWKFPKMLPTGWCGEWQIRKETMQ